MSKMSLLNVAQKTLMVLGAAYLINCGSTVFAPADAQSQADTGYTEYRATCFNGKGDLPAFDTSPGESWTRIEVPGSTPSRLMRATLRAAPKGDEAWTRFKLPHVTTPYTQNFVATGENFDESIWIWCGAEGSEPGRVDYIALVPDA